MTFSCWSTVKNQYIHSFILKRFDFDRKWILPPYEFMLSIWNIQDSVGLPPMCDVRLLWKQGVCIEQLNIFRSNQQPNKENAQAQTVRPADETPLFKT